MSPCGGECRVGRTLLRGGPSSPAHAGADPRRRQHRPIATNKRSTSAAARRPPTAAQSAAQARRAARAPCRSISYAHRLPRARAPQSERCHKPPQRSCLNRGAVAHHPLARAASAAPLARARGFGAIKTNAGLHSAAGSSAGRWRSPCTLRSCSTPSTWRSGSGGRAA